MNDLHLYNRTKDIKLVKLGAKLKNNTRCPRVWEDNNYIKPLQRGRPGAVSYQGGAEDFRAHFKEQHPECKNSTLDNFWTIHSFLLNSTNNMKNGGTYSRLIIDEALMIHAGETLFSTIQAGVTETLLFGDVNQIPEINRTEDFEVKHYDIMEVAEINQVLNHSYRCTRTTAAILNNFYDKGMTNSSKMADTHHCDVTLTASSQLLNTLLPTKHSSSQTDGLMYVTMVKR
ncbi:hypothetical protein J6590_082332 [Homalodisca vitripennis]|nr:hypothetical protein J6590_082332 [Homalodisca vitripennis]